MSIAYQRIARAVALRADMFIDGDKAARETAYTTATVATQLDSALVPPSALKQDILAIEQEIAEIIANSTNAMYRAALAIQSANVASGGNVPTANGSSVPFIGTFDGVFDSADNTPMREMPLQVVLRRVANPNSTWKVAVRYFAIEGTKIFHTTTNVYFRGCGWLYATQSAAYDANGNSLLPSVLEGLWVCKVLARLAQNGWFVPEAQWYQNLAAEQTAALIEGRAQMLALPDQPIKAASAEPVAG